MRHFLLPRPVTAHSGGVPQPALLASLVAPSSCLQGAPPRSRSTAAVAVDLSPVTAVANDHLAAAAGAQKQTARYNPGLHRIAAAR
jgi:hypothetical protein